MPCDQEKRAKPTGQAEKRFLVGGELVDIKELQRRRPSTLYLYGSPEELGLPETVVWMFPGG